MADELLGVAETLRRTPSTPPWGIVERVEEDAVHFRLNGSIPGDPASIARLKLAAVGTIFVGDSILVAQVGRGSWVILDVVVPV